MSSLGRRSIRCRDGSAVRLADSHRVTFRQLKLVHCQAIWQLVTRIAYWYAEWMIPHADLFLYATKSVHLGPRSLQHSRFSHGRLYMDGRILKVGYERQRQICPLKYFPRL